MAGSRNHYEIAFSSLLCSTGSTAMSVEEIRRPVIAGRELKNFDFLVNGPREVWALDLKGRRGTPWITRTDLFSMLGWQTQFNAKARTGFVFGFFAPAGATFTRGVAALPSSLVSTPAGDYRFCLIDIETAQRLVQPRSRRWGTFGFDWKSFAAAAKPLEGIILP